MIHSLSGGVIKENGVYTFAKTEIDGAPFWFIAPDGVEAGDRVIAPVGKNNVMRAGVVRKVERNVSGQCAPFPMNRMKRIARVLPRGESFPENL